MSETLVTTRDEDLCHCVRAFGEGYHIREQTLMDLLAYINTGRPPGRFLFSVLENNLHQSFQRADNSNLSALRDIVKWLHNNAPMDCWRSFDAVNRWIADGGLARIGETICMRCPAARSGKAECAYGRDTSELAEDQRSQLIDAAARAQEQCNHDELEAFARQDERDDASEKMERRHDEE